MWMNFLQKQALICLLNFLRGKEAAVVERLKDAGAIIQGKTVTTEFAYFKSGPTKIHIT